MFGGKIESTMRGMTNLNLSSFWSELKVEFVRRLPHGTSGSLGHGYSLDCALGCYCQSPQSPSQSAASTSKTLTKSHFFHFSSDKI